MTRRMAVHLPAALLFAAIALAAGRAPAQAVGMVRGTVWDSTAARPLAGARVYLQGTTSAAESGPDGGFILAAPGEGRYILAFAHPALGPLGPVLPADTVTLRAGDTVTVALAVPGWRTLLPRLCPDSTLRHEAGVVVGRVTGPGAGAATVTGRWYAKGYSSHGNSFTEGELATRADPDGSYVLCGVSTQSEVTVRAVSGPARGQAETHARNGRPARADVVLRDGSP